MLQARSLAAGLDYVPHNILRDAFSPYLSRSGDGSKDPSVRDPRGSYPLIERCFDPFWDRHGADVAALADQIHYCPVSLAHLDLVQLQADQFRSAEATTEQHGQHGVVSLGAYAMAVCSLQDRRALIWTEPIAGTKPELLGSFHSADACGQFGTQQA